MLNYKKVKSEIALALLTLNTNNSLSSSDIVKYTDEIALLNRKRSHLIKDKIRLEKEVNRLKNRSSHTLCIDSNDLRLSQFHKLYKEGKYDEAKDGYLKLMKNNDFYAYLEFNVELCNKNKGMK